MNKPSQPPDRQSLRFITVRSVLTALLMTLFVNAWIEYSELVTPTSQMSESTPPIPALLGLGALWAGVWLWRRASGWMERSAWAPFAALGGWMARKGLTHFEILAVYLFLIVSCAMPSVGVLRLLLPCFMGPQYFAAPENHYQEMGRHLPPAWAPQDPEDIRAFWEGADRSVPPTRWEQIPLVGPGLEVIYQFFAASVLVPWRSWLLPLVTWSLYITLYFISMFCLVTLFRKRWMEEERLTFPLATMSIELVRTGNSPGTGRPFFRDPIMWTGFGLAFLYNGTNMLHAFNPGVPAMGLMYPIGQLFTEAPWNTMAGLAIWYKPEILGLGYLVPSDILLSIAVFSLAQWFARPAARIAGFEAAGYPWPELQATGALITLGLLFLYQGRRRLWEAVRKAVTGAPEVDDSREPISHRWAVIGAVGGGFLLVAFPVAFGVEWWQALLYIGVGTLFLLAYARNRAETGLPIVWGYPLLMQRQVLISFLGSRPFIAPGRTRSFSLLTVFTFMQRGTWYAITSTEQESCIVGDTMGVGARRTWRLLLIAIITGFLTAFWMYLTAYYTYGGNVMETVGGTAGGQRVQIAMSQFELASRWIDAPVAPNPAEIGATCVGALVALTLALLRRVFLRFPLHPIGYALACCHENFMWFPALTLWTVKTVVTRLGGARLYRRLAPAFIAFTLGHFCAVGLWSLVGLYAGEEVARYRVWFL